jgi:hypothetical protein
LGRRVRRRACPCKRCPGGRPARTRASRSDAFACYGPKIRLPDACGPGADGQRRPCVRPQSSYVCGNRASWPSYGDLADKYASSNSSTGTPKCSIHRREYIRSLQHHPAISKASPPSQTRAIPVPVAEKCCKTAFRVGQRYESSISAQGLKCAQDGLTATPWGGFLSIYPQAVDKFVDNHVNCLQTRILRSWAVAL